MICLSSFQLWKCPYITSIEVCYRGYVRTFSKLNQRDTSKSFKQIFCTLKCVYIFRAPVYIKSNFSVRFDKIIVYLYVFALLFSVFGSSIQKLPDFVRMCVLLWITPFLHRD
jgi:hypothetical protein